MNPRREIEGLEFTMKAVTIDDINTIKGHKIGGYNRSNGYGKVGDKNRHGQSRTRPFKAEKKGVYRILSYPRPLLLWSTSSTDM